MEITADRIYGKAVWPLNVTVIRPRPFNIVVMRPSSANSCFYIRSWWRLNVARFVSWV